MTLDTQPSSVVGALAAQGWVFMRCHRPGASSIEAFSALGEIETVEGLGRVQSLVPKEVSEAHPNTYSGNFGVAEFPLHTDLAHWAAPPRFVALRCITGVQSVATRLFDGHVLVEYFGQDLLRAILVKPRRPMHNRLQLLQLLQRVRSSDSYLLRWDSVYLQPASAKSRKLSQEVAAFLASAKFVEFKLLERGDTLIIDNWRCLHGRDSTPESAGQRRIDRTYLRTVS